MPLVGENRILAHFGLKNLNREPSKGLLSIIKICGLDKHYTIDDIVFKIGRASTPPAACEWTRTTKTPRLRAGTPPVELLIRGATVDRRVRQRRD